MEIDKGRGNANKMMNRVLYHLLSMIEFQLVSIDGGSLRNAIPRESNALVAIDTMNEAAFLLEMKDQADTIKTEFKTKEPDLEITFLKCDTPKKIMDLGVQEGLTRALYAAQNGVYRMSNDMEDLVETSNNVARVIVKDELIKILCLTRSSVETSKKDLANTKIVLSGVGAAGTAVARLLIANGAKNIIGFGKDGLIFADKGDSDPMRKWFVENCSPGSFRGDLSAAMKDADIFIGVSAPNVLTESDVKSMAKNAIVFALANPDPEIDPVIARRHAAVVATGRSDQPNQINNVLAFPGIFRGLLDGHITKITDKMLVLAAEAIASCVSDEQLNANFIVPSVFDLNVVQKVAAAVKKSSKE